MTAYEIHTLIDNAPHCPTPKFLTFRLQCVTIYLVGNYMIVHFFSLQFYVELYELEASQNIKLKQPLYEKRRKVINVKDSHGGESGIDGFWLQVSFYFLK